MTEQGPFDLDAFVSQTIEGEGSTSITPIAQGEYHAMVEDVVPRAWERKDGKGHGISLDVTFALIDDNGTIRESIDGRDPKVTQAYFCDTLPGGMLDMGKGKNVSLNRLREALGQNIPGPWGPLNMKGQGPIAITLGIEQDKRDPRNYFNRVKAVGAIA